MCRCLSHGASCLKTKAVDLGLIWEPVWFICVVWSWWPTLSFPLWLRWCWQWRLKMTTHDRTLSPGPMPGTKTQKRKWSEPSSGFLPASAQLLTVSLPPAQICSLHSCSPAQHVKMLSMIALLLFGNCWLEVIGRCWVGWVWESRLGETGQVTMAKMGMFGTQYEAPTHLLPT